MNAFRMEGVKKSFQNFTLGEISLALPQGCVMGLIGENGAGKTTAIRLLVHSLRPDKGRIEIFGQEIGEDFQKIQENIGVVLDDFGCPECLTPMQIGNIMGNIYRNWEPDTYRDYLKKLDLPLHREFKELSRGMRMKLSIACALSHRAKLLLLDEPTGGLDPVARDQVTDIFNEFTRDETHSILISSHIVSDLEKLCDYVVFLHMGKILLQEEKDRLLDTYGLLSCSPEDLRVLPPQAICQRRDTPYGTAALVRKDCLPSSVRANPVGLEELFVWMVKGGTVS